MEEVTKLQVFFFLCYKIVYLFSMGVGRLSLQLRTIVRMLDG